MAASETQAAMKISMKQQAEENGSSRKPIMKYENIHRKSA
jgi:hypothetical protein